MCILHVTLVSVSSGYLTIHFYDLLEVRKSREDTLTHTPFNTVYTIDTYRNILCSIPAKKKLKWDERHPVTQNPNGISFICYALQSLHRHLCHTQSNHIRASVDALCRDGAIQISRERVQRGRLTRQGTRS